MARSINVIVDLSHRNERLDFVKAKKDGIVGVIHKATQGFTYVDATYSARRRAASDAGLLWGASHFGVGQLCSSGGSGPSWSGGGESRIGPRVRPRLPTQRIVAVAVACPRIKGVYHRSKFDLQLGDVAQQNALQR